MVVVVSGGTVVVVVVEALVSTTGIVVDVVVESVVVGSALTAVVVLVVDDAVDPGTVVLVGDPSRMGVVAPGCGFQLAGGLVCDGTSPAVETTTGVAGWVGVGVLWGGTGIPAACTRPKPARSDHQIELTCTTVPVWGALIMSPSPM